MLASPSTSVANATDTTLHIRRVAVCGAGVMGAQIAAHCINAGIEVVLFDLASTQGSKNAIAEAAIAKLATLRPLPLADPALAALIKPANYDEDLHRLADCDVVIEAIAERLDWKHELYARIAPALGPYTILASNTSGLAIRSLAQALPATLRSRFCGVHFFNPPRYMSLVELIATEHTDSRHLDALESFLVRRLGKGVVRAKDTPNFIANRIGVFGMVSVFEQAKRFGLSYGQVDVLTGTPLGRAKSGTYRTADVVGLDTLMHVINTMASQLKDDPFHPYFRPSKALSTLVEQGALGQKTKAGFYKKVGPDILRFDLDTGTYQASDRQVDEQVLRLLAERDPTKRLQGLRESTHPQAQFVWAILRDLFHYSAVHLAEIAETARDLDVAMKWGFGHKLGPFEIWQQAGWQQVAEWITSDIEAGKALSDAPLPDWVFKGPVAEHQGVQNATGSWNPHTAQFQARSTLAVYERQWLMPLQVGELAAEPTHTVFEDEDVRAWCLDHAEAQGVLVLSFKTPMHTLSPAVVEGVIRAVALAEQEYSALVIAQQNDPFSAGADLKAMLPVLEQGGVTAIDALEQRMQAMMLKVRYAQVPVVVALAGMALGGGCELAVHSAHRVAHLETYIGLVEAGIGLVPGAGGLTYCARRAAELQQLTAPDVPLLAYLQGFALAVANARVSTSAIHAQHLGYLRESDTLVMNRNELLYVAITTARAMANSGYRAPLAKPFAVAGRDAMATLKAQLHNMLKGGFISDHDFNVAAKMAYVVCGGDVDPGSMVDEAWMLKLERDAFLSLLVEPKTQERIAGLLKTGKPVRN